MEKNKADRIQTWLRLYVFLTLFSIAGHFASARFNLAPGVIAPVAGAATLISGIFAAFSDFWTHGGRRAKTSLLFIFILGLLSECIGLRFGWPFGLYHYTRAWAPSVLVPGLGEFPLLLPLAWVLVVGASTLSLAYIRQIWLRCLAASTVATLLDLLMESTLSGKLGYWIWDAHGPLPGGSPWSNSISWFFLSLMGAGAVASTRSSRLSTLGPLIVLAGQFLLMTGLRLS